MSVTIYNGYTLDTQGATVFIFHGSGTKQTKYVGTATSLVNAQTAVDGGTLPTHVLSGPEHTALRATYVVDET